MSGSLSSPRRVKPTRLVLSFLLVPALVGCAQAVEPAPVQDEPAETVVYPIPEGCPTAEEFGLARLAERNWVEAVDLALLSNEVAAPLPEGGCSYAMRDVGVSSNSEATFRRIIVFYFNIQEPGKPTRVEMRDWGLGAGGTPTEIVDRETGTSTGEFSNSSLTLPREFSGWTGSTVSWTEGETREFWFDEEVIPAFIQGASAEVSFAMDESRVDTLVAASLAGTSSVDPVTALAQGFAAPFSASFSIVDEQGYSADVTIRGRLQPWTSDVVNAPPGQFFAFSTGDASGSQTNTTAGRNAEFIGISAIALYPLDTAACRTNIGISVRGDGWSDSSFCYLYVGGFAGATLGPEESRTYPSAPAPLELGPFDETGSALAELHEPVAVYAMFGGKGPNLSGVDWTADKGCQVSTRQGGQWLVPMDGWPDVLCG